MPSALDYAQYLIYLASREPETRKLVPLTPLQLQKHLYYVQGWSWAVRDRPAFTDNLKAWKHGPVVPTVWHAFQDRGGNRIPAERGNPAALSSDEQVFVQGVWHRYRKYSASKLWEMTHEEPPYREARGELPPESKSSPAISQAAMRNYFCSLRRRLVKAEVPDGLQPDQIEKGAQDFAAGRGIDLEDLMADLGHAL